MKLRQFGGLTLALVLLVSVGAGAWDPSPRTLARNKPAEAAETLDAFLAGAPALQEHLVWTTGDGKREPFDQWTPAQKARLEFFYGKLAAGVPNLEMHLPTADKVDGAGYAYFTAEQAFDIYAAHAAHVLYVEARHLVPWSIKERPAVELDMLLAGSAYFARIAKSKQPNTYPKGIEPGRDFRETPEDDQLGEWLGDPGWAMNLFPARPVRPIRTSSAPMKSKP